MGVDLLILDEAGFIDPDMWRQPSPSIIARPGSRGGLVLITVGRPGDFFRQMWQRGLDRPDPDVRRWHWPSSTSARC